MTTPFENIRNAGCTLCPLHRDVQTVCMPADGPVDANIFIVGEAPGANEDFEGMPFIGPAGRLLDSLLSTVGLDRRECVVTNVVKCRPPDNDTPSRGNVKICTMAYLGEELQLVEPEYILILGNAALQGVVGKSGITKHRGNIWEARGAKILATFHPAAVLRNPRYRSLIEADFQRFARLVRGERSPTPETKVQIIRTKPHLKWLVHKIMDAEELSVDIETYTSHPQGTNFQEYRGKQSMVASISFTWQEGQAAVVPLHHAQTPWRDPDGVQRVLGVAIRRSKAKNIGHNFKFDARWMAAKDMGLTQHFCTMLALHMLDENRPKGLKPASQVFLGADAYDVGEELSNAFEMDLKKLCLYNGKDTDYTLRLKHRFTGELKENPRTARVFMKLMMPASNVLVDVERNGIQLDMARWDERFQKASLNTDKVRQYMLQFVPKAKRDTINFASPKQVGEWLFGDLGLDVIETTKTGSPSTREAVLLQLGPEHKAAKALLKWRKWMKYQTTYFLPWRDFRDDQDRIHPTYKLFGTVTGRLSCADPNLQQVPRDPFIRGILGARPGWTLVVADYSQVELRIAAMMANDNTMLGMFLRGEDIHMNMACRLTGKFPGEVTKEERKLAKSVNFGFLYSMGAPKFVEYARDNFELVVSEGEAQVFRNRYFEEFSALPAWHDRQRRLARKHGRVSNLIGRTRHLPDINSKDRGVQGEAERQAINSPVQSFASDMMLTALIQLHEMMDSQEAIITGTVHDSILFEIRDDVVSSWTPVIKATMEDMSTLKRKFGCEVTVPIVADVEVGSHWGECKPWDG